VAFVYGGRSPVILTLCLLVSATLVRTSWGLSIIPRGIVTKVLLIAFAASTVAYSLFVFSSRAELQGTSDVVALRFLEQGLDANVTEQAWDLMNNTYPDQAQLIANTIMATAYITHGASELNYLLTENQEASPFFGAYQFWIINRALRALDVAGSDLTLQMSQRIHRDGLFFTAWGAMWIDFGWWPTIAVAGLLGYCTRHAYELCWERRSLGAPMVLSYLYTFVFLSPLYSVIAFTNGLMTLGVIIATVVFQRQRTRSSRAPVRAAVTLPGGCSGTTTDGRRGRGAT
jgi:hypothetical protein